MGRRFQKDFFSLVANNILPFLLVHYCSEFKHCHCLRYQLVSSIQSMHRYHLAAALFLLNHFISTLILFMLQLHIPFSSPSLLRLYTFISLIASESPAAAATAANTSVRTPWREGGREGEPRRVIKDVHFMFVQHANQP